jgi:hypothetical protein
MTVNSIGGIVFNVATASFSNRVALPINDDPFKLYYGGCAENILKDPLQRKVYGLTKFARICSPNYAGVFQFSPQKNDGFHYIEINCTYKPFMPYIHLNPDFNGLYGQDFNDNRGLICGGDFSLARLNNAWEEFELQNKNY